MFRAISCVVIVGLELRPFFMFLIAVRWLRDWRISPWPMDISRIPAASSADWVNSILNADSVLGLRPSSVPLFILHAAMLCDNLWLARNKATHENHTVDIAELRSSLGFR